LPFGLSKARWCSMVMGRCMELLPLGRTKTAPRAGVGQL
jgi:hypothetical protein